MHRPHWGRWIDAVGRGVRRDVTEAVKVGRRLSRRCLDPGALRSEDDVAAEVVIGCGGLGIGRRRIVQRGSVVRAVAIWYR